MRGRPEAPVGSIISTSLVLYMRGEYGTSSLNESGEKPKLHTGRYHSKFQFKSTDPPQNPTPQSN